MAQVLLYRYLYPNGLYAHVYDTVTKYVSLVAASDPTTFSKPSSELVDEYLITATTMRRVYHTGGGNITQVDASTVEAPPAIPTLTVQQPPDLSLSHNPILLRVESATSGSDGKARAIIDLKTSDPLEEDSIRVVLNGLAFVGGVEIDPARRAQSFVEVATNLPDLDEKYVFLVLASDRVSITARMPGSDFNLMISTEGIDGIESNVAGQYQYRGDGLPNYGVLVEVFEGRTGNFDRPETQNQSELAFLGTLQKNYQRNNQYDFDLSELLSHQFELSLLLLLPDLNAPISYVEGQVRNYYVKVYEQYTTPPGVQRMKYLRFEGDIQQYLYGAMPLSPTYTLEPYRIPPVTPLSLFPFHKPVALGQPELFAFLVDVSKGNFLIPGLDLAAAQLTADVEIRRKDGTLENQEVPLYTTPSAGGVYYLRADPVSLNLTSPATLDYYDVRVTAAGYGLTQYKRYVPYQPSGAVTTLAFLSDLGTYETFSFAGDHEEEVDRDADTYLQTLPVQPRRADRYVTTRRAETTTTRRYHSLPLQPAVAATLRSLAQSSVDVYRLEGTDYIPVTVVDVPAASSNQDKFSLVTLTVRDSQPENHLRR